MDIESDWQSGKTLAESHKIMYENEIATDVTFVFPADQQKVKAHKFVLMSRSHVFYVMFSSSLHEPGKDIEITDIEPNVFKDLLKFLYFDDVKISNENTFHLLYAAEKYQVEVLKANCIEFLQKRLSVNTIASTLDHAVLYNEAKLIRICQTFLSFNATESLKALKDYHVSKETLELILDCETLPINETHIFEACVSWATEECEQQEIPVNGANKRKVLGPMLQKIRFCSMTCEDVSSKVSPCGILTLQEEVDIFRFISSSSEINAPFPHKRRVTSKLTFLLPPTFNQNKCPPANSFSFGNPYATTKPFQMNITCPRKFQLFGILFSEAGSFKIKVNGNNVEEISASEPGVATYLTEPVTCGMNTVVCIQGSKMPQGSLQQSYPPFGGHFYMADPCNQHQHQGDNEWMTSFVTGSFQRDPPSVILSMKRVGNAPVPFTGLILAI